MAYDLMDIVDRLKSRYVNKQMDIGFETDDFNKEFLKAYNLLSLINLDQYKENGVLVHKVTVTDIATVSIIHELQIMMNSFKQLNFNNICISYASNDTLLVKHQKPKKYHFIKLRNNCSYGNDDNTKKRIHIELFRKLSNQNLNNIILDKVSQYCLLSEAIKAFCCFWGTAQTTNIRLGMLSRPVDLVWHWAIGDTELYNEMCSIYGGKFISHEDGTSGSYEKDMNDYIKNTLRFCCDIEAINSNPFSVWPLPRRLFENLGITDAISIQYDNMVYDVKVPYDKKKSLYNVVRMQVESQVGDFLKYWKPISYKDITIGNLINSEKSSYTRPSSPPKGWTKTSSNKTSSRSSTKRSSTRSSSRRSNGSSPSYDSDDSSAALMGVAAATIAASCSSGSSCPSCSTASCGSSCGGASCGGC